MVVLLEGADFSSDSWTLDKDGGDIDEDEEGAEEEDDDDGGPETGSEAVFSILAKVAFPPHVVGVAAFPSSLAFLLVFGCSTFPSLWSSRSFFWLLP